MAEWTETTSQVGLPMWTADDNLHAILQRAPNAFWLYKIGEPDVQGKYETLADAEAAVP